MMEKRGLLIGTILFTLLISISFVAAVPANDLVNITSIRRYGNYSTTLNVTAITSITNSTAGAASYPFNVTLYCNATGGAVIKTGKDIINVVTLYNGTNGNATGAGGYATLSNASVDLTRADIVGNETYSNSSKRIWNCSLYADNYTDNNWSYANGPISLNLSSLIFDSTPPNVSFSGITNTVNYGNYSSQVLIINVSIIDSVMGIERVYFNVTFSNGTQVNFTRAINSGNYFNITLDTSVFQDGFYNITIYANDTFTSKSTAAGEVNVSNLNSTERIYVTLDKTAPLGTYSCSPTSAYSGDTVTCGCSPTDATSGVDPSATSSTINPSTTDTGTHSLTCTFKDFAGNSGSATASFIIEIYRSASSGSSGTTAATFSYSRTIPQTAQDFSVMQTIQTSSFSGGGLGAKERVKFKINSVEHFVGIRTITASSATVEIASDPVQENMNIGDEKKIDLNNDGYYDVSLKLNGITNGKADLTIQYIHELIPAAPTGTQTPSGGSAEEVPVLGLKSYWMWISLGAIVLIAAGIAFFLMKKKRR